MHARHETKFLPDGKPNPKWKPDKRKKAVKDIWVAWDGEGYQDENGQHYYTLFGAYWEDGTPEGKMMYIEAAKGKRLSTLDILRFIRHVVSKCPEDAIHVAFSMNYDNAHIFYDLDWGTAKNALAGGSKIVARYRGFRFRITPRKTTQIYFPTWRSKMKPEEKRKHRLILYDVYGFFQSSFVTAVQSWLGEDYPDLPLIIEGKAARGQADSPIDQKRYMKAELRALVRMMSRLNQAFLAQGFVLQRWDGAGAAGTAAFRRFMKKGWFDASRQPLIDNPVLNDAVEHAYFGGRVEMLKFGYYSGLIYEYDINSAYPHAMRTIPDISKGKWRRRSGGGLSDAPMALYHVVWDFTKTKVLGPFPLRTDKGTVYFPPAGEGWYWSVEVDAVLDELSTNPYYRGCSLQILERWEWDGPSSSPFSWVEELYQRRQECVREGKEGEQKALKLALNSLYGKTAQRVGYIPIEELVVDYTTGKKEVIEHEKPTLPPFYNLIIAGWITATCRSMVFRAASADPTAVVAIATDGILSIRPLPVDISKDKELGKWGEKIIDGELASVQAGVRWVIDRKGRARVKTRGFMPPRDEIETMTGMNALREGWRRGARSIFVPDRRFISMKQAAVSPKTWNQRGIFKEEYREVKLFPPDSGDKRTLPKGWKGNPADELIQTYPNQPMPNLLGEVGDYVMSVSCRAIDLETVRKIKREEREEWDRKVAKDREVCYNSE